MVSGATGTQIAAALPIEAATGVPARKIAEAVAAYLIDCDDFEAWLTDTVLAYAAARRDPAVLVGQLPGLVPALDAFLRGERVFVHRMIADAKAVLRGPKAEATSFQREDAHDQLELFAPQRAVLDWACREEKTTGTPRTTLRKHAKV